MMTGFKIIAGPQSKVWQSNFVLVASVLLPICCHIGWGMPYLCIFVKGVVTLFGAFTDKWVWTLVCGRNYNISNDQVKVEAKIKMLNYFACQLWVKRVGANGKMTNLMPWRDGRLTFLKLLILVFHFYSRNTHLLPHKPKSSFRHLKRGIQDFHMNYILVPADKAAYNGIAVWRLYYINTLKRELVDTNAYKLQPSLSERVIVDWHGCHTALHLVSKLKKIKTKFLRCTGYLNSIKTL